MTAAKPENERKEHRDSGAQTDVEELKDGEVLVEETEAAAKPTEDVEGLSKEQEYLQLAQRTQADFENYRKRVARDAQLSQSRIRASIAKDFLPVLDHFDVALQGAVNTPGESAEVITGFNLIRAEMLSALGKHGVEPFSPLGEQFNPNEHEAMVQQPVEGTEAGTIVEVFQQGYRLDGSVLRPARVVVAV